jgi:hypothetical protein
MTPLIKLDQIRQKSPHSNINVNRNQSAKIQEYTTRPFLLMQILKEKGAVLCKTNENSKKHITSNQFSMNYLLYG